jgi:hypothetical protein
MTSSGEQRPGVVDMRARRGYRPDVVSLACGRVAAARRQAGLPVPAFAAVLGQLLGWRPAPDMVRAWEAGVPPPGQVVIACEIVGSRRAHTEAEDDGDEVASAAREAEADQSLLIAEPGTQPVDFLWRAALDIARSANRSAAQTFGAAHQLRRQAVTMAGGTRRPETLSDLYMLTGQATALMASTAFDLDRWDESAALARSAVSYAALTGHSSLHAWTLGLAALLANWRNEPQIALDHFRHGMEVAPPGAPRVRLRYIAVRSYALLGDAAAVGHVLDQARRDQDDAERHHDLLSEEIAGEFAFGPARAEACAASAWLDLGRGREAEAAAQRALDDLTALPAGRQPLSQITGARIDLATACLLERDRDQAEDVLGQVIAVPSPLRNVSLAGRLARTRKTLASPHWSADRAAQQLSDAIGGWITGLS